MPYSTGSEDSGVGLRYFNYSHCHSAATSSLTCSEEDECHCTKERIFVQKVPRSPRGGKNRKSRRNKKFTVQVARPTSTPSSIGTCSEQDSIEECLFGYSDVVHLYVNFQQLFISIREQQKYFQEMAKIVGDIDARWGANGYKNGWKIDPTGSLAPSPTGESQFFDGFWAYPHPAVYLALQANYVLEYLHFLRCIYPQLSNASMLGSNIHRLPYVESKDRQRRQRNGENTNDMARLLQMMERQHVQSASPPPPLEAAENVWPVPGNPTDSKTEVVPPPLVTSPPKQNYSEVVARSTPRSSVSDVPKEQTPILYSQKAASSLHAHEGKVHHEPKKESCLVQKPEQLISAKSECTVRGDRRVCPETETVQTPSNIAGRGVCTTAENKVSEKSPPSPSAAPSPPPSEPVNEAGNFEISKMDVLSEQIWHFHNKITQKESTLTRKLSLRDMLYFAICPVFPMCGLYVVGSSLNGFGNDKSDMDLCLMITNKEIDQKSDAVLILNMILSTLQKMDWVVHQKLILAKVPILRIKFAAPYQDITVDLNANNSVAIRNTHLLCYYSSFDWRVRPLVSTVKEWAKRKGINDANRSSFTSYSLVLMVIHYLQCGTDPQILPSLQNKYNKRFNGRLDVRTLNVTQALPNMEPPWKYHDKSSLGELLIGFLKYFATKFDYNTHAISVREGKPVSRSAVMRPQPGYSNNVTWRSQWRCICIEEPFTFNNTAHSIYDEMVFDAIKRAFEEAFEDLDKTRDISCLLECIPITVIPPIHGATAFVCDGINKETILEAAMIHGEPTPSDLLLSNSGSSISLHTAELGSGSACNSMYGEDNEKENYQRPSSTESMSMRSHGGQRNPTTNGRSYNNSRHRGARQGPRGGANPIRYQQRGSS